MPTIDDKIAELKKKLKQATAQKQQVEARKKATEIKQKRSDDTRRKILVGAAVLSKVENGVWKESQLHELLNGYLNRADDKALFGLPELAS